MKYLVAEHARKRVRMTTARHLPETHAVTTNFTRIHWPVDDRTDKRSREELTLDDARVPENVNRLVVAESEVWVETSTLRQVVRVFDRTT